MSIHHSQVTVQGNGTLNNVAGNQLINSHNQTITVTGVANFVNQLKEVESTEYDEFETVKRGRVVIAKELHSEEFNDREWKWENGHLIPRLLRKCKRTIQTVQVYPDQQSKFTALIYEGDSEDARSWWEEDFRQLSGTRNATSFQLFGVNRSDVPMLIFHDDLTPLGHFYDNVRSIWNDVYIRHLASNANCAFPWNLWMNAKGTICGGPEGPNFHPSIGTSDSSVLVPPTINMLEGDNSFLFLAKYRSKILDQCILQYALTRSIFAYLDDSFPNLEMSEDWFTVIHDRSYWIISGFFRKTPKQLPMEVIGSLRFDTVYSSSLEPIARRPEGRNLWWKVDTWDVRRTLVGDGWTRCAAEILFESRWLELTLYGEQEIDGYGFRIWGDAWLAQSSRVTSVLGLVEMDSAMILTPPSLTLEGKPPSGQYFGLVAFFKLCDGEEPPPLYLFIHPPPTCISELISWEDGTTPAYFWSFDETGQTCLSEEECEEWGIPELKPSYRGLLLYRWPAEAYQALHDWQVARDFDPTTADFARHLGYPELEILGTPKKTESRFEEIREEETGKNSHASVGVQAEDRRASKRKADIPSKSAVRPALLQQSRSPAIATSSMEEASRSEIADGNARRLRNTLSGLAGKLR